jgi:type IV secretory pathway VirB2 component (pilin)
MGSFLEGYRRRLIGALPYILFTSAMLLLAGRADAGDPIGWSDAAQQIVDGGVAAGIVLTVLGIVATGAVLWFGLTSLLAVTLPMTLGGVVMANAEEIGGTLFGASAGGGLVNRTVYAAPLDPGGESAPTRR